MHYHRIFGPIIAHPVQMASFKESSRDKSFGLPLEVKFNGKINTSVCCYVKQHGRTDSANLRIASKCLNFEISRCERIKKCSQLPRQTAATERYRWATHSTNKSNVQNKSSLHPHTFLLVSLQGSLLLREAQNFYQTLHIHHCQQLS